MGKRIGDALARVLSGFTLLLMKILFRPKILYTSPEAEAQLKAGGHILAANHASLLDMPLLCAALPGRPCAIIALDMLERHRLLRWLMRGYPHIPVNRKEFSMAWLRQSRKALAEGQTVVIAPEGRINPERVVREFKSGVTLLAATTQQPIQLIYQNAKFYPLIGPRWKALVGEQIPPLPLAQGTDPVQLQSQANALHAQMLTLEQSLTGTIREGDRTN